MTELKQTLTLLRGTGLMLNIVVGAGLLALPGLTVAVAGDQALWAWLVCAVAALPLLLVFVILGGRHLDAGGIAHFVKLAFGEHGYIAASLIFLGAVAFGLPSHLPPGITLPPSPAVRRRRLPAELLSLRRCV